MRGLRDRQAVPLTPSRRLFAPVGPDSTTVHETQRYGYALGEASSGDGATPLPRKTTREPQEQGHGGGRLILLVETTVRVYLVLAVLAVEPPES